jgi:transcriptional regulator with XRE-family HTH domain
MNAFKALLNLSGMSQAQAAAYLDISPSTIDKACRGKRTTPEYAIEKLAELIQRQTDAADEALNLFDDNPDMRPVVYHPQTDDEARKLGWPCLAAWWAMAARIAAEMPNEVQFQPRIDIDVEKDTKH